MWRFLLWALLALTCLGPALAEDVDDSAPLVFNVRPSRTEGAGAERQARLLRRARDLDFAFRSICIGCGATAANPNAAGAAFSPYNVLATRPSRSTDDQRQANAAVR